MHSERSYGQTYHSLAGPVKIIYSTDQAHHQGKPTRFCEDCRKRRICFKDSGRVLCLPCTKRLGFSANKSAWHLDTARTRGTRGGNATRKAAYWTRVNNQRDYNGPAALTPQYTY